MRTVFAWSYRALPLDAARLFRLLGLHPGPDFSDHAAAALAGTTTRQIRHVVDTLVGAHMVEQTAFDRYQLHDLLRAYASDQARHEETDEGRLSVLRRVLSWYLHTADAAQARIAPQEPRLSLDLPSASGPGWPQATGVEPLEFGDYDEAIRWHEAETANLVAATRAAADAGFHRIAWQLAVSGIRVGRLSYADRLTTAQIGLDAARTDGDRDAQAELQKGLAETYRQFQRLEQSAERYQAALALRRELGDVHGEAMTLNGLGLLARRQRRLDEARGFYEQAVARLRELGDTYSEAVVGANLSRVYVDLDRLTEAADPVLQALEVFRAHDDIRSEGNALNTLSMIHRASGRPAEALVAAERAVQIARDLEYPVGEGFWLIELGDAQRAVGRPGEALESYHRAADLNRRLRDRGREALAWDGAGLAYRELDRPAEAAAFHRQAAVVHRDLGDAWQLAIALDHLATALHESAHHEEAEVDAPEAKEAARRQWRAALDALAGFDDPQAAKLRAHITAALGGA